MYMIIKKLKKIKDYPEFNNNFKVICIKIGLIFEKIIILVCK